MTGAAIVLSTLPASRTGFSFSFASFDFTNTIRIGHMFAEVGPIFAQVVDLPQQRVVHRLVQPGGVRPAPSRNRMSRLSSFSTLLTFRPSQCFRVRTVGDNVARSDAEHR